MARFLKSRIKAKGAAPGSLIFMGKQQMDSVKIRLISYSDKQVSEHEFKSFAEAAGAIKSGCVNWLNIDGLHDVAMLDEIGKRYKISPIALENILNTGQRSRFFEDDHFVALISKAVYFHEKDELISSEQVSFILLDNLLISFQERVGDHFEPVRKRIRNGSGRIRTSKAGYLLYALVDCLVDNYLIDLEKLGARIEAVDTQLSDPTKELGRMLFKYKTEISFFRKNIKPLKEVLNRLLRSNNMLVKQEQQPFFQELYDVEEQANEEAESYYNMISDQINLYNANISNKANQVMKVLTIFASIFIPLTFIAGIYGTNFDYLPELHFKYSYFIMWGIMLLVAAVMLAYFKKHKWF